VLRFILAVCLLLKSSSDIDKLCITLVPPGKVKVTWIYIVPSGATSKELGRGSHSFFTCKLHHACIYMVVL